MTSLKKIYFFIALFLLIVNQETLADTKGFIPDAPIINFKIPMFTQEGYQSWYIHGDEGIYINEEQIDILGMQLMIFSADKHECLQTTIESPKATIIPYENKAKSNNKIQATGNGYRLSGKNWIWSGKLKKITINQNVKIIFDQPLTNLFAYEKK
jgi:lipopolysaccharide export system protein LptC